VLLSARYAPARELFREGKFAGAAEKLSALGYFTAPVESSGYKHMAELAGEFKTNVLPKLDVDGLRQTMTVATAASSNVATWPLWLGLAALAGLVGWQVYESAQEDQADAQRRAEAERELADNLRLIVA